MICDQHEEHTMQSPRPNSLAAFGFALLFAPTLACTGTTQQAADNAQLGSELKGGNPAGGHSANQNNSDKGKHLGQAGGGAGHGEMEAGRKAHAGSGGSEDDDQDIDESSGGSAGHGHAGKNGHGNSAGHGDKQDGDDALDEGTAGSAGS
jgi:hypothetical protein